VWRCRPGKGRGIQEKKKERRELKKKRITLAGSLIGEEEAQSRCWVYQVGDSIGKLGNLGEESFTGGTNKGYLNRGDLHCLSRGGKKNKRGSIKGIHL